jgi:hypothetical protein
LIKIADEFAFKSKRDFTIIKNALKFADEMEDKTIKHADESPNLAYKILYNEFKRMED